MPENVLDFVYFNSHAHVERDWFGGIDYVLCKNFNSHAHVERDGRVLKCPDSMDISTHTLTWSVTFTHVNCDCYRVISTHTLTWSVTQKNICRTPIKSNFNSHAHVERDTTTIHDEYIASNFNSHAHVERDVAITGESDSSIDFNSHAHVERDRRLPD